jgi:hypothetical protein
VSLGMYLRSASDIDVRIGWQVPSRLGERLVVYDGKVAYVSKDNFEWMKTAPSDELGAMRVMRVTAAHTKGWLPKAPKLETFRYAP